MLQTPPASTGTAQLMSWTPDAAATGQCPSMRESMKAENVPSAAR